MMLAQTGLRGFTAVLVILALGFAGCINPNEEDDPLVNPNLEAVLTTGSTGGGSSGTGTSGPGILTINPSAVRIAINQSMTFTAAGGEPPYAFSLQMGSGSIVGGTGVYVAPGAEGTDLIRVTDNATPPAISDATVSIYDPATQPNSYRIVCTDLTPPATAIVVPPSTPVNFRIVNGTPPDSFNVTNMSQGNPQGFWVASRTGTWMTGGQGADDGSVVDTLQVFDSSSPLNVSTLKIYVCQTPLAVNPTWAVVPASNNQTFNATSTGVGQLSWSVPPATNQSGGSVPGGSIGPNVVYTAGTNTQGIIGASDVVQVDDSFPNAAPLPPGYPAGLHQVAQASVTVPGLSAYPREAHIRPSPAGSVQIFGLGGAGASNYTWSLFQNRSGSSMGTQSGVASITYTPGTLEGLDIIELQDGTVGGVIRIPVTVCNNIITRTFNISTTYYPSSGLFSNYAPLDMVVDDFDGDNSPDVAAPCSSSIRSVYPNLSGNQVSVLLGSGTGNFASSATKYTIPAMGPWGIASGDFNADGNRDLAVACYTSNELVVMFGDGTGGFPNSGAGNLNYIIMSLGQGMAPTGIESYNFDRASGDDLVITDGVSGQVLVYLSNGGGPGNPPAGFRLAATLQVSDPNTTDSVLPMCMDVAVANFDNDNTGLANRTGNDLDGIGLVDIAVTDYAYDSVVIFQASGLDSWSSQWSYPVYPGAPTPPTSVRKPVGITAGYFGGTSDTTVDIAVANNGVAQTYQGVSVLNNMGGAAHPFLGAPTEYGSSSSYPRYYWDVLAYDMDNDGEDDLVATARNVRPNLGLTTNTYYYRYSCALVWEGMGNGTFTGWTSASTSGTWYYPYYRYHFATAICIIDFGGQTHGSPGAPLADLIMANQSSSTYTWSNKLVILENRSQ